MESLQLIRENLLRSKAIVLARIEEMEEHCLTPPHSRGGCHTLWILGHLAFIEGLVIHDFMQGETNPRAGWKSLFDGDFISIDQADYPTFQQVLSACRAARMATIDRLDALTESELDQAGRNVPADAMNLLGTWRHCFQYCADHWLMHRGHLANARSAAGLQKMWY